EIDGNDVEQIRRALTEANAVRGKETVISAADSAVKVLLIPTNEELMIAMDTAAIVKG
ncbi:MAG: hypothetical protein PUC45_01925, partial [Oscillospiraceae bacterium]|nr:hypothetical protein [Oscillospiraceae bacterium]